MRMQNLAAVELQQRLGVLAARIHAATAELVELAAQLDTDGAWADAGMRSCAHWLSINIGVDVWTGGEMVRAGHALEVLPALRAAFADGRLSFDKIRAVTRVATPEEEEVWLMVALHASGGQLARICRGVRRALAADDPRRQDDPLVNRGVRVWWRDDGMLELMAVLPEEDGALVMAAIEAAAHRLATEQRQVPSPDAPQLDPSRRTRPTLRADALVRVCEAWVAAAAQEPVVAPTAQVVVHVDAAVLSGEAPGGRCHIEDGPWLSTATLRTLSCDADVVTVTERGGLPIDVGRARRLVTPRLRLALQSRDQGCRYPGCSVPAPHTDGHHVRHWCDGGRTELRNLVSLCRFHHRRHHEGRFHVEPDPSGGFIFATADGRQIMPVVCNPALERLSVDAWSDPEVARARDAGAPCDFAHVVSVLSSPVPAAPTLAMPVLAAPVPATPVLATERHGDDRLATTGDADEPDPELIALASALLAAETAARPLTGASARAGPGR
jgi:hypothetical protein